MRSPERPQIPEWARKERASDLAWIKENWHIFWPAAQQGYKESGRDGIVVDTTARPTGEGNPFAYLPETGIEKLKDRMPYGWSGPYMGAGGYAFEK